MYKRFSIGEKIFVIAYTVYSENLGGEIKIPKSFGPFGPRVDMIIDVSIKQLTCVEEHLVPIEYTDNQKTYGYLFKDADGVIYNNQYPQAYYSQTSTENDYIFSSATLEKGVINAYSLLSNELENLLAVLSKVDRTTDFNIYSEIKKIYLKAVKAYKDVFKVSPTFSRKIFKRTNGEPPIVLKNNFTLKKVKPGLKVGNVLKLKINGCKEKFQILGPNDIITEGCYFSIPLVAEQPLCYDQTLSAFEEALKEYDVPFVSVKLIGDTVSDEHTCRVYVKKVPFNRSVVTI